MTGGAGTIYESDVVTFDDEALYEEILPLSISRTIFPVATILDVHLQNYTYWDLINDIGTYYSMDPAEIPESKTALKKTNVEVPLITTVAARYNRHQLARIKASRANVEDRLEQVARVFARDEDMYAIAGENTENGVTSFADTTNNTTVATAELDLTSFTTLKTTLNGLINQLNGNLTSNGGNQHVKQFPLVLLCTSDVENRLWNMASTLDDNIHGFSMAMTILTGRGGPNSGIVVSNYLGATPSKSGNRFVVNTDGTTNACLFAYSTGHAVIVASEMNTIHEETQKKGLEIIKEERWRAVFIQPLAFIYSATVDITA